jgi:hypothetical protein
MASKIKLDQKTGGDFQNSFQRNFESDFKICTASEQPRLQMVSFAYVINYKLYLQPPIYEYFREA